ncbi:MAG: hypothetical protein A2577_12825 [Bdellovibrionales bacterium RIFOXYD1_FULL_36_51]|nr:MAG: hypothetical protein A2577_12825 [Bdellovibrionales bacterium RIFOXYD1_FULL_36_51]
MTTKTKYGTKDLENDFGLATFGELLKNFRETEGLSQRDFSKFLKISPQRLNDFEKGRRLPDIESAVKFSKILKDSEAFFIQILFQDYIRQENLKLVVKVTSIINSSNIDYSDIPASTTKELAKAKRIKLHK